MAEIPEPTAPLVEKLIGANVHVAVGLGADAYRRLWPDHIRRPSRCEPGSFRLVLVDRDALERRYATIVDAMRLRDLAGLAKLGQHEDREQLKRYALFVRATEDRRRWTPRTVTLSARETHIDAAEGLFFCLCQPDLVDRVAVDCAASRENAVGAVPSFDVSKFRLRLYMRDPEIPAKHHVFATQAHVAPIL
jgi:hypothetical protein